MDDRNVRFLSTRFKEAVELRQISFGNVRMNERNERGNIWYQGNKSGNDWNRSEAFGGYMHNRGVLIPSKGLHK